MLGVLALAAAAADCATHLYPNTECTRDPYHTQHVSNYGACCSGCVADPECQAWTFHPGSGVCYFTLAAGVHPAAAKGQYCGTKQPLPGPSPPSPAPPVDPDFDCGMRRLALEYAAAVLPRNHSDTVAEALQLQAACGAAAAGTIRHRRPPSRAPTAAAPSYWVDPAGGDDAGSGSELHPWKTLARAADELAKRPAAAAATVNLLSGMHYVGKTLELDARHSGVAGGAVVFRAAPGTAPASVTVSGAVALGGLSWQPAGGHWTARVTSAPERFESLFAGDKRQTRARWPNGDPETYCPRDFHGGNCPGYAQPSDKVVSSKEPAGTPVAAKPNVQLFARESGALIAEGFMKPLNQTHVFNVSTPGPAWHARKKTFSTFQAYEGGAIDRFDTTTTKAFWNTKTAMSMYLDKSKFTNKTWGHPELAIVHIYQTDYWGSWQFKVSAVDRGAGEMKFSAGGFQEARGGTIGGKGGRGRYQDYFVENVLEELDAPLEFYFDAGSKTLHWLPSTGTAPTGAEMLYAPAMETVVAMRGASQQEPVQHVMWEGVSFKHTLPTFLSKHEPTSGGDWAVNRGAGVVVENAVGVRFEGCRWEAIEGNGLIFSRYVRQSGVSNSEFFNIGATPVVLLGALDLMDGRAGNHPDGTQVTHNYIHAFGVWNRQAAGYFEGLSRRANVSYNVVHDGPRAGLNFNDGFGGGLNCEGNLVFNVVQDTGEHGSTNSWDRSPMVWYDDAGELVTAPETRRIARNFVFRNSFRGPTSNKWCLDKDDGSSDYLEEGNVLVYGAIKDRDGLSRVAAGNLFLYPDKMPFEDTTNTHDAMAFQVNEYQWDSFVNNTVVSDLGAVYECTSPFSAAGNPTTGNNTFVTPNNTALPFSAGNCVKGVKTFEQWQALGHDAGSKQASTVLSADGAVAMARRWLPLI